MENEERTARAQALSLLKRKLQKSGRFRSEPASPEERGDDVGNQDEGDDVSVRDAQSAIYHDDVVIPTQREQPAACVVVMKRASGAATGGRGVDAASVPQEPDLRLYARKPLKKLVARWSCTRCQRECIPVREESRCLCGHRYKEHPSSSDDARVVKSKLASFQPFACTAAKCGCTAFFYVVAEGAWILRCRCKHKHTDHDATSKPFRCGKAKCGCAGFDSPWVCNCDHAWSDHVQETIEKEFKPLELFHEQFHVEELSQVKRTDLVAEPMRF